MPEWGLATFRVLSTLRAKDGRDLPGGSPMRKLVAAVSAVLLVALMQSAAAQAPEKRKIQIATASLGLPYLPLIIAQQRKYFADEGLEVDIVAFAGGSKALQALMGGSTDIVSGAYSNTLTMAAKGQRLVNFAVQVRYPALTVGVAKHASGRYKSLADLKGMKIGVSAPGSSTHMVVAHLLTKAGLTSADVSIIGVGTSGAAVAAIQKGEIDAIINSDPVMTKLETDGDVTVIAETRTRKGTEAVFGGPYPEAGLYTTGEFIAKNPNTVQAITNAIVRAELWMQTASIDDIAANVPAEHMLGDRALYLESYKRMRESHAPDGRITREGAQIVLDVLAAFLPEVKAANIKVEDTYDNRFVEAALKRWQGKM
jgi:NitT/TauT family transport system substrate-binding protein